MKLRQAIAWYLFTGQAPLRLAWGCVTAHCHCQQERRDEIQTLLEQPSATDKALCITASTLETEIIPRRRRVPVHVAGQHTHTHTHTRTHARTHAHTHTHTHNHAYIYCDSFCLGFALELINFLHYAHDPFTSIVHHLCTYFVNGPIKCISHNHSL